MSETNVSHSQRPLSPHLQIYKLPMTAIMSIMHRASGAALAIGTLMLTWMLVAAATSEAAFDQFMSFSGSPLGLFMIFGWSVALYYHLCNGVRHMFWDTGALLKKDSARKSGILVLLATAILTVATWVCAWPF